MIRVAEAVLNGHPDKFCDILADRLLSEAYKVDPECYGQIEIGVWSDCLWFSGTICTRQPLPKTLQDLVVEVGRDIGYTGGNHIDAVKYRIMNEACFNVCDPTTWTKHVNDQSIAIGWAGYDEKTHYLPPEQYLVHYLRHGLVQSCKDGLLVGHGPDGKVLVRIREEGSRWLLEQVLVTIQQKEETPFLDVITGAEQVFSAIYSDLRNRDQRWIRDWSEVEVLVNPNGPLLNGGSDGDNGQTGRKLVMDYYGPRVPIGGGALSGKDLTHIDRVGAYGARQAAVTAIVSGATTCKVTLIYAPNRNEPLDVIYDMEGQGVVFKKEDFRHRVLTNKFAHGVDVGTLGCGIHFFDPSLPWNQT